MEIHTIEPNQRDLAILKRIYTFWEIAAPRAKTIISQWKKNTTPLEKSVTLQLELLNALIKKIEAEGSHPNELINQLSALQKKEESFEKRKSQAIELLKNGENTKEAALNQAQKLIELLEKESLQRSIISEESAERLPPYIQLLCQFPTQFLLVKETKLAAEEEKNGKQKIAQERINSLKSRWADHPEPWLTEILRTL